MLQCMQLVQQPLTCPMAPGALLLPCALTAAAHGALATTLKQQQQQHDAAVTVWQLQDDTGSVQCVRGNSSMMQGTPTNCQDTAGQYTLLQNDVPHVHVLLQAAAEARSPNPT